MCASNDRGAGVPWLGCTEANRSDAMAVIERAAWATHPRRWNGEIEGGPHGAGISVIFFTTTTVGEGPRLHRHPYPETFIIRSGRGLFTIGDREIEAVAGQILVVPANSPHAFRNLGPGPFETTDIHESPRFITEWLA